MDPKRPKSPLRDVLDTVSWPALPQRVPDQTAEAGGGDEAEEAGAVGGSPSVAVEIGTVNISVGETVTTPDETRKRARDPTSTPNTPSGRQKRSRSIASPEELTS